MRVLILYMINLNVPQINNNIEPHTVRASVSKNKSGLHSDSYCSSCDLKTKQIAFKSIPLYKVNVKRLMPNDKYQLVPAYFSELDPRSPLDKEAVRSLKRKYESSTKYFTRMTDVFLEGWNDFYSNYVIETVDEAGRLGDRITSLMLTYKPTINHKNEPFGIAFLESIPTIYNSSKPSIKGSGELSVYGAAKIADKYGYNSVMLTSTNDSFYDKIGFKKVLQRDRSDDYFLPKQDYVDFCQEKMKKYGFS